MAKTLVKDSSWATDLAIIRLSKNKFSIEGIEEAGEDLTMSKLQLNKLLTKCLSYDAEELAFMYLDFDRNPQHRVAYFGGFNGLFLYTK